MALATTKCVVCRGPNSVLMRDETISKTGKGDPGDRVTLPVACEQTLLFGRAKRVSLARSREARCVRPNRRACSQATLPVKSCL